MKIRLWGTRRECEEAAEMLAEIMKIDRQTGPRKDRAGQLVRVYIVASPLRGGTDG